MHVAPWGGAGDPCLAARNAVMTTSLASARSMSPQKTPTRQRRTNLLTAPPVAGIDCLSLLQSPPTSPIGGQVTPSRWPPTPLTSGADGTESLMVQSPSSTGQLTSTRCTTFPYPSRSQMGMADVQRAATQRAPSRGASGPGGTGHFGCANYAFQRGPDRGPALLRPAADSEEPIRAVRRGPTVSSGGAPQDAISSGSAQLTSRPIAAAVEAQNTAIFSNITRNLPAGQRCGLGGFTDARAAARHCNLTPEVREPGSRDSLGAEAFSESLHHTSCTYACPSCSQGGFLDARSAANHCAQWRSGHTSSTASTAKAYADVLVDASGFRSDHNSLHACPPTTGLLHASVARSVSQQPSKFGVHTQTATGGSVGSATCQPMPASGLDARLPQRKARKSRSNPCIGRSSQDPAIRSPTFSPKRCSVSETPESCRARPKQRELDAVGTCMKGKIERYVDQGTGQAQTVVHNGDGSRKAFGESSVCSLVTSCEEDVNELIDWLNDLELQGLVHEFNQRIIETSQLHDRRQDVHDRLSELCDLAFFGLDWGATVKALEKAYKQMAKKMHPDRNGSTKEANDRFQEMKERYERLRKKLIEYWKAREQDEARRKKEARPRRKLSESGLEDLKKVVAAVAREHAAAVGEHTIMHESLGAEEDDSENQGPDRDELHKACWKMLRRTKTLQEKIVCINDQIADLQQELVQLKAKQPKVANVAGPM